MLYLTVSPNSDLRLVDQIVAGIKRQIQDRRLRPGAKLPSIRNFAETYSVSRLTVVEAYDRLVAMGGQGADLLERGCDDLASGVAGLQRWSRSESEDRLEWEIRRVGSGGLRPIQLGLRGDAHHRVYPIYVLSTHRTWVEERSQ